jgi:sigma-B regulation protein RsbU (phosphoserine phosphatase)
MKEFFAKAVFFFTADGKKIKLESISSQDMESLDKIIFSQLKVNLKSEFEINKKFIFGKIKKGELSKEILKEFFINKGIALILPLYQNKKLYAFFIFLFGDIFSYFNASRLSSMNSRKLKEVILDIIAVIKERHQNINMLIMGSIKDYAFITVDTELHITSWNKGAEMMFGYDPIEVVNKKITDFIDPESLDAFYESITKLERTGEVKIFIKTRDYNRTQLISEMVMKRVVIEDIYTGIYLVIKDITKEEIWKNNLRQQAMINKSIVENARDIILLLNEENRIIFLNEKIYKIIDPAVSCIGRMVTDIFPLSYSQKIKEKIDEVKNSEIELSFLNIKILDTWYNVRFFPIKSEGIFKGVIIFFIDNTYLMKTREKVEEMNASLIENLRTAKLMHSTLIPAVLPENETIRFQVIFMPSDEIGGDFYYVDEIHITQKYCLPGETENANKKYYLAMIADVSGHGVGASMLTVLVKDVYNDFKSSLQSEEDIVLARFLQMLNKKMINLNMQGSKFVTVMIALIDVEDKFIKYSSAGHPNAIIIRDERKMDMFGIEKSPPVGIIEDYIYKEETKKIKAKDKIFIYSDGILDPFSNEMEQFRKFLFTLKKMDIAEMKQNIEKEIDIKTKKIEEEEGEISSITRDDITVLLAEIL